MSQTRRLAAILAADVAGYSRLMGADEEGTHERLRAHLRELVDPKIAEHRGRTVKNTGDGLLAEFASVVDAVRCAVEVQRSMVDREPGVPDTQRIRFRIGINLGDVIVEEHDIFGDGVNVAARLEALAEPGGICWMVGCAEDPSLMGSHLFRRTAQGRDAGGVSAAALVGHVPRSLLLSADGRRSAPPCARSTGPTQPGSSIREWSFRLARPWWRHGAAAQASTSALAPQPVRAHGAIPSCGFG